ncbi:MAG: methionyl-tRNA formyltransferase [Bacteroidota bacterium]
MQSKLRIIFMGTPEFAVPSLQQLVVNHFNVVAVVTAPDKPQGRGKKLRTSPVKDYALSVSIPLLQPTNLKDPEFVETLKSYQADLQIIVAFRMLPEVVWSMPKIGSFNLHASLLPQYRGAAPINWAIINGEKETGVTTFMLKHEIDTGNILFQEREPIHENDTAGSLYERLMTRGSKLVVKTVRTIESGDYILTPQIEPKEEQHAPKIFRQDCHIIWDQPAENARNFVRGLNPYPAAWTTLDGKILKVLSIETSGKDPSKHPGFIKAEGNDKISVETKDQIIYITELQLEGKRRMSAEEFLRGYNLTESTLT